MIFEFGALQTIIRHTSSFCQARIMVRKKKLHRREKRKAIEKFKEENEGYEFIVTSEDGTDVLEDVLLIPPKLTKTSWDLLVNTGCAARSWHLEGRYGSRTHRYNDTTMGLPIAISPQSLKDDKSNEFPELKALLEKEGVSLIRKPFSISNRAFSIPNLDVTQHPERAPPKSKEISTVAISNNEGKDFIEQHEEVVSKREPPGMESCLTKRSLPGAPASGAQFTYAELFAGIGGFGVALEALGGRCVFCSELEENCRAVYQKNFPNTPIDAIYGDIYKVPDEALPSTELDLLVGGFPCQPFSSLGDQPGLKCPKGRGNLFLQIVRVLRISKPKAFILENVQGLLQMEDTLKIIVEAFKQAGYSVTMEVCNAKCVTVTTRKRLFFVGFRLDDATTKTTVQSNDTQQAKANQIDQHTTAMKSEIQQLQPESKEPAPFEFPYIPDLGLRSRDVIEYGNDIKTMEMVMREGDAHSRLIDLLRLSEPTMEQLCGRGTRWRPASMAWPNSVCECLTSHYGNSVGRGETQLVPQHFPHRPRRFSPREIARIMGFPNSFQLGDRKERQGDMAYLKEHYRMFGNAVCPPLIAAIAGSVLAHCFPKTRGAEESASEGGKVRGTNESIDWVQFGRQTAIRMAYEATLPASAKSEIPTAAIPSTSLRQLKRRRLEKT